MTQSERFLDGKVALVTGGTRGIGYAIAERLLDAGATVVICGRNPKGVETAVTGLRSKTNGKVGGKDTDLCIVEEVRGLFAMIDQEFGGLDILVNNAGIGVFAPTASLSLTDWKRTIETNLTAVFSCCQEAIARFRSRGGGFIVNLGSLAGKNPFAGGAAYNASKFALNGFSEAMMLDHRHEDVRVCTIMPGSVDTDFSPRSAGKRSDWKIAPADIAEIVLMVLRLPARTMVSAVEVRPSRPARG